jgi:hypothetical protein
MSNPGKTIIYTYEKQKLLNPLRPRRHVSIELSIRSPQDPELSSYFLDLGHGNPEAVEAL